MKILNLVVLFVNMPYKLHKQYRLPEFDYSSNNAYFITICTKERAHYFGEISGEEMFYTDIGLYATELLESAGSKISHLKISSFIVMPNHIHFLAIINNPEHENVECDRGIHPLIPKSISSFTNHFKGKVKRWCNENDYVFFEWQARFHDRIVRDRNEYFAIQNYIQNNVATWAEDPENELNTNFKR